jgi:integrase
MPRRRRRRGEGSVFYSKADGAWIARYSLGVRDGRRVGRKVRAATEAEARAELERLHRAYGNDVAPARDTLDAYLEQWLRDHGPSVRPSTRVSYEGHVRMHISPLLGGIPVARLRTSDVRRLIADRLAVGLSPATVRRIHATLHVALAQGVDDRSLPDNAAAGVPLPKVPERRVEAMTEDRANAVRDALHGTFIGDLVELLLGSGMRLGEALGLDQGDLHLDEGFVLVRVTKTTPRAVRISDDAVTALRRQLARNKRRGAGEPVFVGPRSGERITASTVTHAMPRMLEDAGLPRLTPHGLRHGVATMMVARGVHMRAVADQLGHRNPSMTAKVYAHVTPEALKDAVQLLNRRTEVR